MEKVKTIQMGADLVFCPDPQEMYQGHKTYIKVEDLSSSRQGCINRENRRGR